VIVNFTCGVENSEAAFVGVFDGHNGDTMAKHLEQTLYKYFMLDGGCTTNGSEALHNAFLSLERDTAHEYFLDKSQIEDLPRDDSPADELVAGSTALVGLVSGCNLYIGNAGDCRAVAARKWPKQNVTDSVTPWEPGTRVETLKGRGSDTGQRGTVVELRSAEKQLYVIKLARDGSLRPFRRSALRLVSELQAVRLTEDHKPNTARERSRIEALGGKVEDSRGAARILGLATSRSFGSFTKRPFVTAEPDVFAYNLHTADYVFLILASDGVWDVLDDQLAIDLVWDQLSSAHDSRRGPASVLDGAAQLVVQKALELGSTDNLTCAIVLFLRPSCLSGVGDGCHTHDHAFGSAKL